MTALTADFSAKGKSTLDQLEDTRAEMKLMQQRFSEQESQWKEQNSLLQIDAESKSQRLQILEADVEKLEKLRFELTTKNATLQEKIVSLQSEVI